MKLLVKLTTILVIIGISLFSFQYSPISLEQNTNSTLLVRNGPDTGPAAMGTAILINEEYILTAYHLLSEDEKIPNNFTIWDNFSNEYKAEVFAVDAATDLMILKLSSKSKEANKPQFVCELPPIGSDIYTIGHPEGIFKLITFGKVSMRQPPAQYRTTTMFVGNMGLFQGNSGGGVYDVRGHVIGIVSAIHMWDGEHPAPIAFLISPETVCAFMDKHKMTYKKVPSFLA